VNKHRTIHRWKLSSFAVSVFVLSVCLRADGAPIFVETFDNGNLPGSNQDAGAQFETGLDLSAFGDVLGWSESGHATVHAVDRIAGTGTDFAVMIWSGDPTFPPSSENIITLDSGIAANNLGTVYAVDFEVSPAVYILGAQTTTATDSLLIEILKADNSILTSFNSFPGEWAGAMAFIDDGFTYTGDGTGAVRLRISSTNPLNTIFAGAIDNLQVGVAAVPEPSSLVLLGLGALGLIAYRRRRNAA